MTAFSRKFRLFNQNNKQQQQQQQLTTPKIRTVPKEDANQLRNQMSIKQHESRCHERMHEENSHRCKSRRIKSNATSHQFKSLTSIIFSIIIIIILATTSISNKCHAHYHQAEHDEAANANPGASEASEPVVASSSTSGASSCFGGLQIFEKISMSSFESIGNPNVSNTNNGQSGASSSSSFVNGVLIQQDDQALTSECLNICRSQANCLSFVIDYNKFECKSYATTQQELQQELDSKFQHSRSVNTNSSSSNGGDFVAQASSIHASHLLPSASSNYFEKVCLEGVANRQLFSDICGSNRLWAIERVVDSFLDGFVERELPNVNTKDECSKMCLFESSFVCRSADFDSQARLCRLSKEDRRTQPQAMRSLPNSGRQYLENQCATPGPSTCVYELKKNVGIISMDALKFAQSVQDCQMKCNQETSFNCRSYSLHQQRCFLSGDDSTSLNSNIIKLPVRQGWHFGEKKCLVELCSKGIFSYERISGFTLRSALTTPIDLMGVPMGAAASQLHAIRVSAPPSKSAMVIDGQEDAHSGDNLELLDPQESAMMQSSQQHQNQAYKLSSFLPAFLRPADRSKRVPSTNNKSNVTLELLDAEASQQQPSGGSITSRSRTNNNLAITQQCRHSCDLGYLNCPAFTLDYKNNRCQKLDRNSQGRHQELVPQEGFSYYEKICLRVPEIMSMCQDRYWIFERVLGYELAPHLYEKSIKFVQSRRDCQEYCLEEKQFACRSALYNDETSDCKLSSFDRRLVGPMGGYYRNFNSRISYLENQCVRDHAATISIASPQQASSEQKPKHSLSCAYEQASDQPSYPTFTEHIEMVPLPATTTPGTDSSNNVTGVNYCKQLCNANENFECHSFGYYAATAQCFLSADDTVSAGASAASPSTGFTYFEKRCRLTANNGNQTSNTGNVNPPFTSTTNQPDATSGAAGDDATAGPSDPYLNPNRRPTTISNSNITIHIDQQMNTNNQQVPPSRNKNNDQSSATTQQTGANTGPDQYKCGLGHKFVYQRISGFEPIGGYLTLLIRDNTAPGIVSDCAQLCKRAFECRAFVVDYNSNQCFAMLENSSVGLLSLRQTIGKDYFEGFCVQENLLISSQSSSANNNGSYCGNKTWIMDKIVDQAAIGVQHQRLLQDSDRVSCRRACLEERLFYCKSAMFDSAKNECKLFSIDRESVPQMRLIFTRGVDFYENQCQISTSQCPYDAIERDITMVTAIKSVQALSTLECELACNLETSFNCRSYTYHDHYPSLPNTCLLSSDSRSTSQRGSVREQSRTLYAERNCYYRRPRYPAANSNYASDSPPPSTVDISTSSYNYNSNIPRQTGGAETPPEFGLLDQAVGQALCEPHQFTFERTFGYDFRLAPKERAPIAPTVAIAIGCQQACLKREKCQSFVVEYGLPYQSCFLMESQAGANRRLLTRSTLSAYFEKVCLPRTGIEAPQKTPESSMASHSSLINPSRQYQQQNYQHYHAYNRRSFARLDPRSLQYSAGTPTNSEPLEGLSDNISPSYSAIPWAPASPNDIGANGADKQQQASNNVPYYYQQQALVHNYPSRSCAKLWSFERFLMHNFTAQPDKLLEQVLSRSQCEAACLNEASFMCRSGTYDYSLRLCRLFKNTRRTLLSQFVDLEAPATSTSQQQASSTSTLLPSSSPGIATIIPTSSSITANDIHHVDSLTSEMSQLQSTTTTTTSSTSTPSSGSQQAADMDYFENTCVPEPSSCQYRIMYDLFSPYIDKITHAVSLSDCQRQCDLERLFACKSINYEPQSKNCMLINEDLISLNKNNNNGQHLPEIQQGSSHVPHPLIARRGSVYGEKGNCEMISVQCNSQEMLVSVNFDAPFRGRIMAKGNPEQCFVLGDGQTSIHFPIVFGPKCNSRQEGHNTFTNEIVVQQHPVIMTESDKTVRVMCAFEAPEQTISLAKNPSSSSRDNNRTAGGIDVNAPEAGMRTRHDKQQFSSVVSSKAPPPTVVLRILDQQGRDANMINLGDDLQLRIQMQEQAGKNSALGIFARNLIAKSSSGESLLLIDHDGCPVDPTVFSALEVDLRGDGKSLQTSFKAFRFPSSGMVNFEVQIRFCPERCPPVDCQRGPRMRSYGRKRRRRDTQQPDPMDESSNNNLDRTSLIQSVDQAILKPISTVMKPGKAFQFVRELMLQQDHLAKPDEPSHETNTNTNDNTNEGPNANNQEYGNTMSEENDQPTTTNTTTLTPMDDTPSPSVENSDQTSGNPANNENDSSLNDGKTPVAGQSQKSPLMHMDEKVNVPANQVYPGSQAPYGRFPHNPELDILRPSLITNPAGPQAVNQINRDTPLKFSILVADNQPSQQAPSSPQSELNWAAHNSPPMTTIMNTSDIDLDHIVIPGKEGQFFDPSSSSGSSANTVENTNAQPTKFDPQLLDATSAASSNSIQTTGERHSISNIDSPLASESNILNRNTHESAASKAHSDCAIDGSLSGSPSSSTSTSSSIANNRTRLWTIIWTGTFVILVNVCLVILSLVLYFKRLHSSKNHNIMFGATPSTTDRRIFPDNTYSSGFGPQNSSSSSSRVHRGVDSRSPGRGDGLGGFGGLGARRGAFRWPSVLMRSSKNIDLSNNNGGGTTSLNAHEHFFCKLNNQTNNNNHNNNLNLNDEQRNQSNLNAAPTTGVSTTISSNDYSNWTNLSRDSSLALTRSEANQGTKFPVLGSLSRPHRYAFDLANIAQQNNELLTSSNQGFSARNKTSTNLSNPYQGDFNRAFGHSKLGAEHL